MLLFLRKMIADIFGESGDEEEEEFTVSSGSSLKAFKNQQKLRSSELLKQIYSSFKFHGFIEEKIHLDKITFIIRLGGCVYVLTIRQ